MVLPDDSSDVSTGIACLVVSESVMEISSQRGTEEEKRYRRGREGGRRGQNLFAICYFGKLSRLPLLFVPSRLMRDEN